MKKLLAAAAAALLIPLSARGAGGDDAPAAKKLTFWHIQTRDPARSVIDGAVERFKRAHPGVEVEVSRIENDAFKIKLAVAMTAGSPPDVFYTWGGGVLADDAAAGRILKLDGLIPAAHLEALNPAALEFCRSGGGLYGLPADVAAVVFWYNKDIFAANGLTPPATYKELLAVCDKIKAAGVTPISLGNSKAWPGAFFFSYLSMRMGGAEPFSEALARKQGPGFEHESFIRAGSMITELADSGYLTKGFNGIDYQRARDLFLEGRAAMMLMGSWILADARKKEGFLGNMGCFAFPVVEGGEGDPFQVLGGVNAGYAVSSKCPHPQEAAALLIELTSLETCRLWAAETGRIPALALSGEAVTLLPPETREVAALLGNARGIQLYYDQALPRDLADLHKTTTQGIFAGTKTPVEAARLMAAAAPAAGVSSETPKGTPMMLFVVLGVLGVLVLILAARRKTSGGQ